jgi:hypothetical protein
LPPNAAVAAIPDQRRTATLSSRDAPTSTILIDEFDRALAKMRTVETGEGVFKILGLLFNHVARDRHRLPAVSLDVGSDSTSSG